jgi:hypothetical protein
MQNSERDPSFYTHAKGDSYLFRNINNEEHLPMNFIM